MTNTRAVLTIATGKPVYIQLAVNLAYSFFWWHPDSDIEFQLVTDQPDNIPADLKDKIHIITIKPGEYGSSFSSKLYLDKLSISDKTLFIDSDCLIFENLKSVFEQFNGHAVSVVGGYIDKGEWFGDISEICRDFNVPHLPKFNGGIYYIENGDTANRVYQTARELEKKYDKIGFVRLRNSPNDEVLMALAMQLHQQTPITDDGTIMSDPQACQGGYHIDAINGKRRLVNPPAPHKLHQEWYPFQKVSPLVVHFLGSYTHDYPYRREAYKLKKACTNSFKTQTVLAAFLMIELPLRLKIFAKNVLRPVYHKIFGTRKVKISERI